MHNSLLLSFLDNIHFGHSGELSEPNCEERESNDDCCVLVVCSATEGEEEEEDGEINDEGTQVVDSFDIEREGKHGWIRVVS